MKRLISRKLKRRGILFLIAALFGAVSVSLIYWFLLSPQSVELPNVYSEAVINVPGKTQSSSEKENKTHKALVCTDLFHHICSMGVTKDPTGDVRADTAGELEVLRIYEELARTKRKINASQLDELLVRKIYTPQKTKLLRDLFNDAKKILSKSLDDQLFENLSVQNKELLKSRIDSVNLELPPPASVYADEPDLFTKNDVFFEKTADSRMRVRIGGALLFTVKSQFNLAFTLSHELAHAIDPCELRGLNIDVFQYDSLLNCFNSSIQTLEMDCSPQGKLSELFADWIATHVVAEILTKASESFPHQQLKYAVFNTVRDLCTEDEVTDFKSSENTQLGSSHPPGEYRVNRIFAQHPKIRKLLSCPEAMGPELPGAAQYCFWPKKR